MNIVFFGSSHFAQPSLTALITNGYEISGIVTQPDKKKGRGLVVGSTLIKETAIGADLKIFQPANINSAESIKTLKDLVPDLFVVLAYGQILSKDVLNIPRIMSINIHASLLPLFRGAAPINWAIIKDEKLTGNTLMKIIPRMDAGPSILQKKREILDTDTAVSLEEKLSQDAAGLLLEGLKLIETKKYKLIPQDDKKATFAPKLKKENGLINWNKSAREIYNLIRGCFNWPGAFTYYKGKLLKIYKAKVVGLSGYRVIGAPGEITQVSKEGSIVVAAGKGSLAIEELQIEGKKRMAAREFILGYRIVVGNKFEYFPKI
jgi:methionyl-tRNA formyltransferase